MPAIEVARGVYWVGAHDWNLRFCGSYNTPRGTTYNAYLIVDEKIALIDTVKDGFEYEMLERIKEIVDPAKIDYLISQHSERDHSGAMPEITKIATKAKVIATQAGKEALALQFGTAWQAEAVKTGDQISLGKKTLKFIEAKMLHWPDNMFTYLKEDGILFSNDAFGQHIATAERFSDEADHEAIDEEMTKYFAVIVSVYAKIVKEKIEEIERMNLDIKLIAPSHGVIWRKPQHVLGHYKRWSSGEAGRNVVIVFDTMWQSTEKMAKEIARGIMDVGVKVRVFNLRSSDWSVVIKEIIESRLILVGSPTLNMNMFPSVGGFLTFLKGIRPPNKKAASFGSYGWGKGAVALVNEELKKMGFEVLEGIEIKYVPFEKELETCFAFGKKIASQI